MKDFVNDCPFCNGDMEVGSLYRGRIPNTPKECPEVVIVSNTDRHSLLCYPVKHCFQEDFLEWKEPVKTLVRGVADAVYDRYKAVWDIHSDQVYTHGVIELELKEKFF